MVTGRFESGGNGLVNYRLYQLDGAGRITTAEWVEAADDEEACRKARAEYSSGRFELWQQKRLVDCSDADAA
jgi:hypothetical protein